MTFLLVWNTLPLQVISQKGSPPLHNTLFLSSEPACSLDTDFALHTFFWLLSLQFPEVSQYVFINWWNKTCIGNLTFSKHIWRILFSNEVQILVYNLKYVKYFLTTKSVQVNHPHLDISDRFLKQYFKICNTYISQTKNYILWLGGNLDHSSKNKPAANSLISNSTGCLALRKRPCPPINNAETLRTQQTQALSSNLLLALTDTDDTDFCQVARMAAVLCSY